MIYICGVRVYPYIVIVLDKRFNWYKGYYGFYVTLLNSSDISPMTETTLPRTEPIFSKSKFT